MDTGSGKFEALVEDVDGRHLQFCSNVTETSDGTIYFTVDECVHLRALQGRSKGDPAAACSGAIPTAQY